MIDHTKLQQGDELICADGTHRSFSQSTSQHILAFGAATPHAWNLNGTHISEGKYNIVAVKRNGVTVQGIGLTKTPNVFDLIVERVEKLEKIVGELAPYTCIDEADSPSALSLELVRAREQLIKTREERNKAQQTCGALNLELARIREERNKAQQTCEQLKTEKQGLHAQICDLIEKSHKDSEHHAFKENEILKQALKNRLRLKIDDMGILWLEWPSNRVSLSVPTVPGRPILSDHFMSAVNHSRLIDNMVNL